jgi:hypothetical protein
MIGSSAGNEPETGMGATTAPLSIETFRTWLEARPDNEHWELIGGVIMMMAPATHDHQRIASNLERLLNAALEKHRPERAAYQRVGLNRAMCTSGILTAVACSSSINIESKSAFHF